jgi:hypothetical protein
MTELESEPKQQRGPFARLRSSSLCRRDVAITTRWAAIGWWESRRVPFNLIVGSAGILTIVIVSIVALGTSVLFEGDFGAPNPPMFALVGILIYAIMANVFYTGGWLAELMIRQFWPGEADRFATLSLSLGLVFSVLLTLMPGIVVGAAGIFGLIRHVIGGAHKL